MSRLCWPHLSVCGLVLALAQPEHPEQPHKEEQITNPSIRTDLYGDPLPVGAMARMGTVRGRHDQAISFVAFLPDGKNVLTVGQDQLIRLWDAKSGKELRRFGNPRKRGQEADFFGNLPRRFRSSANIAMPFHAGLSADGKLLACGGQDGPVRLWDVVIGKEIHQINVPRLKIPGGPPLVGLPGMMGVSNLALSPDGKVVAGTSMDGTIHLWAASTAKEIKQIAQAKNQNGSNWGLLAFSPDGMTIVDFFVEFGNENHTESLRLWDVATAEKRLQIRVQNAMVKGFKAVYSPDGKILACNDLQGTVRFLNPETGQEIGRLMEPRLWGSFIFSPDSKTLITEDFGNHTIKSWDVRSGQEQRTIVKGYSAGLLSTRAASGSMALSPDGTMLALGHDRVLCIGDMATGKEVFSVERNQHAVTRVHFLDDQSLVIQSEDKTSCVWETTTCKLRREISLFPTDSLFESSHAVDLLNMAVDMSNDGGKFAVGFADNRINICDATTGKKLHSIKGEKTGFSAFAFSPDGKVLAAQEMVSPLVHLYDVATGKEIRRLDGPSIGMASNQGVLRGLSNHSLGLIFSSDGKRLAASIDKKSLGVWKVETGRQVGLIQLSDASPPLALSFSPDNKMLALATEGDGVILWEIASSQVRRYLGKRPGVVERADNMAGMMRPGNAMGAIVEIMSLYAEAATNLTFSPDGKVLCQVRSDQKIALWETATGRELMQLDGHQGDITSLAFSSNGKRLASGGSDTTALLWDLDSLLPSHEGAKNELSEKEIQAQWANLAVTDAAKAYQSICKLSEASDSIVAFLKKNLKATQAVEVGHIGKLITELDDKEFDARQKASDELEHLGELTVPAVRKALQSKPSAETRRRLEQLLSSIDGRVNLVGERLRILRAIEVLERTRTPEARQLLQTLANGAPGALQTEEAKESLQRPSKIGQE
jgi:WD40 repeat protein